MPKTQRHAQGAIKRKSLGTESFLERSKDDAGARERLMGAATRLFAEQGLEGTSTRDIARAAELNVSLISYYFGGKEGLYQTVLRQFADRLQTETQRLLESLDLQNLTRESFQKVMRSFISEMLRLKLSHREIHTLLDREMASGLPHSKDIIGRVYQQILENITGIFVQGQKKGFVRREIDPHILFFTMVQSANIYIQMSSCCAQVTGIQDKFLNLPEQINEYGDQMYLIFVEGVLL
jgi:AcrR family transcriptional regulator